MQLRAPTCSHLVLVKKTLYIISSSLSLYLKSMGSPLKPPSDSHITFFDRDPGRPVHPTHTGVHLAVRPAASGSNRPVAGTHWEDSGWITLWTPVAHVGLPLWTRGTCPIHVDLIRTYAKAYPPGVKETKVMVIPRILGRQSLVCDNKKHH
jgi:hypothetical protein